MMSASNTSIEWNVAFVYKVLYLDTIIFIKNAFCINFMSKIIIN